MAALFLWSLRPKPLKSSLIWPIPHPAMSPLPSTCNQNLPTHPHLHCYILTHALVTLALTHPLYGLSATWQPEIPFYNIRCHSSAQKSQTASHRTASKSPRALQSQTVPLLCGHLLSPSPPATPLPKHIDTVPPQGCHSSCSHLQSYCSFLIYHVCCLLHPQPRKVSSRRAGSVLALSTGSPQVSTAAHSTRQVLVNMYCKNE